MSGSAGAGEDYRQSWRGVAALDVQTNGGAADGKAENERGQAGATGVRQTAQSQAAAIAPATGSPAGVKLLVSSMDERLAAMQREIDTTKAQNRLLATRLRQIAAAYRTAAATAPMGGASALGGDGRGVRRPRRTRRRDAQPGRAGHRTGKRSFTPVGDR